MDFRSQSLFNISHGGSKDLEVVWMVLFTFCHCFQFPVCDESGFGSQRLWIFCQCFIAGEGGLVKVEVDLVFGSVESGIMMLHPRHAQHEVFFLVRHHICPDAVVDPTDV